MIESIICENEMHHEKQDKILLSLLKCLCLCSPCTALLEVTLVMISSTMCKILV